MRRISVEYAKQGMQLGSPVFHKYGEMLVPAGTELTEKNIKMLAENGVWELLIEDHRVDDLKIKPLVKLDMQNEAVAAMHRLIDINKNRDRRDKGRKDFTDDEMFEARINVERLTYAIVQAILVSPLGEPDISGCLLVDDFHYVQPVQSTALAIVLAREVGLANTALLNVGRAAMLQNIGYIWIPSQIWEKKTARTDTEEAEFRKHPTFGAEILNQYERVPKEVVEAVLQHHERFDGTGYPNGVKGWDVSPLAQLISITETYYELVSTRPGRRAFMPADAFDYIMAEGERMFDPELVRVFARRVPIFPSGIMVKLNSGEIGIVMNVNLGHIGRPVVRIVQDAKGKDVKPPFDMDLATTEYQNKKVVEVLEILGG